MNIIIQSGILKLVYIWTSDSFDFLDQINSNRVFPVNKQANKITKPNSVYLNYSTHQLSYETHNFSFLEKMSQ